MKAKIFHNPRCSKSRQTLQLLEERNVDIEVVEYLKTAPTAAVVLELLKMLNIEPHELVRNGEAEYAESGLSKASNAQDVAAAIAQFPKLLQRPVVVVDGKAAIGRPPESVLTLLGE